MIDFDNDQADFDGDGEFDAIDLSVINNNENNSEVNQTRKTGCAVVFLLIPLLSFYLSFIFFV